jgi:hypothetical protein
MYSVPFPYLSPMASYGIFCLMKLQKVYCTECVSVIGGAKRVQNSELQTFKMFAANCHNLDTSIIQKWHPMDWHCVDCMLSKTPSNPILDWPSTGICLWMEALNANNSNNSPKLCNYRLRRPGCALFDAAMPRICQGCNEVSMWCLKWLPFTLDSHCLSMQPKPLLVKRNCLTVTRTALLNDAKRIDCSFRSGRKWKWQQNMYPHSSKKRHSKLEGLKTINSQLQAWGRSSEPFWLALCGGQWLICAACTSATSDPEQWRKLGRGSLGRAKDKECPKNRPYPLVI